MSLMERINKALDKGLAKEVPNKAVSSGGGRFDHVETESDNDSDFDDDVSLEECAKRAIMESSSSKEPGRDLLKKTIEQNQQKRHSINQTGSVDISSEDNIHSSEIEDDLPALSFLKTKQVEGSSTVSKPKSKAEREIVREQKRKAKEAEKLAKLEEKKRKIEERESKKRSAEMEKALKKADSMKLKSESLDQCLKYITTVLDASILNDGGGSILQALDTLGVQYEVKKLPVEASIGWMRDHVEFKVEDNCQIKRLSNYQEENTILMRLKAEDFAKMIYAGEHGRGMACASSSTATIFERVEAAERLLPNKKLSILITGMNAYMNWVGDYTDFKRNFKEHHCINTPAKHTHYVLTVSIHRPPDKKMKAKSTAKTKAMPQISKVDIEQVLLRLQFQYNYCVHFCETPEDLAQMVASFTKSVAEKPYKKIAGTAFNIYLNNHEKGLPKVGKDGQGLLEVWSRQIQQFKGVGHDTAVAIVQKYPSPLILMQAYDKCTSEKEARLLLQDIEVRRGHGVLATSRRVGPELSKKIHLLMTSLDGEVELAK
eukprot:gene8993-9954_t